LEAGSRRKSPKQKLKKGGVTTKEGKPDSPRGGSPEKEASPQEKRHKTSRN